MCAEERGLARSEMHILEIKRKKVKVPIVTVTVVWADYSNVLVTVSCEGRRWLLPFIQ